MVEGTYPRNPPPFGLAALVHASSHAVAKETSRVHAGEAGPHGHAVMVICAEDLWWGIHQRWRLHVAHKSPIAMLGMLVMRIHGAGWPSMCARSFSRPWSLFLGFLPLDLFRCSVPTNQSSQSIEVIKPRWKRKYAGVRRGGAKVCPQVAKGVESVEK